MPFLTVSAVLICYNKEGALPHVIEALGRNTCLPDRVVLADDASTDHSVACFEAMCRAHALPCQVVRLPDTGQRRRLNTLRNMGVSACPEGLVLFLDADHVPART